MYDDVFVSKWDSQGNLVMAKAMGGPLFDQGTDIAVDLQGNMYTIGLFQGTADFDPGPGTVNLSVYMTMTFLYLSWMATSSRPFSRMCPLVFGQIAMLSVFTKRV